VDVLYNRLLAYFLMVTGAGPGVGGADAVSTIEKLLRVGPNVMVVATNESLQVCGAGEQMQGALFRGAKENGLGRDQFGGRGRCAERAGPQVFGFMAGTLGIEFDGAGSHRNNGPYAGIFPWKRHCRI
jgi:hypothetical protein